MALGRRCCIQGLSYNIATTLPLKRGKVIHLIDLGIYMEILDKLARSGTGALGAESWAELDPGAKFLWIMMILTFLPTLLFTILAFADSVI